MTDVHRVRTFIRYLNYTQLRKDKIIPPETMFMGIPKGGKMPYLARKMGYSDFGLWMENIITLSILNKPLEMAKSTLPTDLQKYFKTQDYVCIRDLVFQKLGDAKPEDVQIQSEWTCRIGDGAITIQGHPDLVVGDCIYDIKTTGRFNAMRIDSILQLLTYACIGNILHSNKYKKIGLILPAQNKIIEYDVSKFNTKPFERCIYNAIQTKIERVNLYKCTVQESLEFHYIRSVYVGSHVKKNNLLKYMRYNRPMQFFVAGRTNSNVVVDGKFTKSLKESILHHNARIYIHAPYTLNPSNRYPREGETQAWVCKKLISLLKFGVETGIKGVVIHVGKIGSKGCGNSWRVALRNMFETVCCVAEYASEECPLLIETPARQKGELLETCSKFLSFYMSLPRYIRTKVKICIDTCHVHAGGESPDEYLLEALKSKVPVGLIHYNDSKERLGACLDRHAPIGEGFVGFRALYNVLGTAVVNEIDCVHE